LNGVIAPLAGPSAASADHKQRFGRIRLKKMTAAFAAKALQPLITAFGNFKKFGHSAGNFHIIRRNNRNSTKWRAAEFWQSVRSKAMILFDYISPITFMSPQ
jgi:hypothetical protein